MKNSKTLEFAEPNRWLGKIKFSCRFIAFANVLGILLLFGTVTGLSLEPRTWIIIDGRTFEAELQKVSGTQVTLLDKGKHQVTLDKSWLSFGDLDYIKEKIPEGKSPGFAPSPTTTVAFPNPAKQVKIDLKTFTKVAGTLSIERVGSFEILETPHFKIMFQKRGEPNDVAELAERMWFDAAFFYGSFRGKFQDRKMAVFLCSDESSYARLGEWYEAMVKSSGQAEAAATIGATWPMSAAGTIQIPRDLSESNNLLGQARVFRCDKATASNPARRELVRGVWDPIRVHCLAGDMLRLQAGYVQESGSKGYYAITTGHSYNKEILLAGRSETNLIRASVSGSGAISNVSVTGGFKDSGSWPQDLKRFVRKGDIKPSIDAIYNIQSDSAEPKDNVLAYSFARYLQSTREKLSSFNKAIEHVNDLKRVPEADELAKLYGFPNATAMEADWIKYINGPEFR